MQKWKKIGLIYTPDGSIDGMNTHASVPFVSQMIGNIANIFFSSRDKTQASSIFSLKLDLISFEIISVNEEPILKPGNLGTFDDSGVMGCCVIQDDDAYKLYYIGWNLGVTVPFRNSIGVASSKDNMIYERDFEGPIIDRTKDEPHFCASNCVIKEDGIYKIWYLSCTGWTLDDKGKPTHRYHIKYAESKDGVNWNREGHVAIDYLDEYEYAISVPRVIKDGGLYKMWFSSRATKDVDSYRIRYAESHDGKYWLRKDDEVGLSISDYGWDSEMVCYPFVFDHNGTRYMLYNGNGYGKTGFGLAVLESE
ncbi:MAG: hypothetical protein ACRCRU_01735 [Vibrio sp.]|uniref:hypothetical protein n=1 Tax=Vibrio sp. TaxID=678 RepID=UPI003F2EBD85